MTSLQAGVLLMVLIAVGILVRFITGTVRDEIRYRRRMRMHGALKAENRMAEWTPEEVEK